MSDPNYPQGGSGDPGDSRISDLRRYSLASPEFLDSLSFPGQIPHAVQPLPLPSLQSHTQHSGGQRELSTTSHLRNLPMDQSAFYIMSNTDSGEASELSYEERKQERKKVCFALQDRVNSRKYRARQRAKREAEREANLRQQLATSSTATSYTPASSHGAFSGPSASTGPGQTSQIPSQVGDSSAPKVSFYDPETRS
nr:hypothetical protein L203_02638 [Cryptococcus depauperatus CBS 7841]